MYELYILIANIYSFLCACDKCFGFVFVFFPKIIMDKCTKNTVKVDKENS